MASRDITSCELSPGLLLELCETDSRLSVEWGVPMLLLLLDSELSASPKWAFFLLLPRDLLRRTDGEGGRSSLAGPCWLSSLDREIVATVVTPSDSCDLEKLSFKVEGRKRLEMVMCGGDGGTTGWRGGVEEWLALLSELDEGFMSEREMDSMAAIPSDRTVVVGLEVMSPPPADSPSSHEDEEDSGEKFRDSLFRRSPPPPLCGGEAIEGGGGDCSTATAGPDTLDSEPRPSAISSIMTASSSSARLGSPGPLSPSVIAPPNVGKSPGASREPVGDGDDDWKADKALSECIFRMSKTAGLRSSAATLLGRAEYHESAFFATGENAVEKKNVKFAQSSYFNTIINRKNGILFIEKVI